MVNSRQEGDAGQPGQEIIYNGSIQDTEDPLIVVQGPDEESSSVSQGHILIVWKLSALLVRPRLRLQNPSVVFSATAKMRPVEQVQNVTLREEYLPSQVPSAINLLEVGQTSSALHNSFPRLQYLIFHLAHSKKGVQR